MIFIAKIYRVMKLSIEAYGNHILRQKCAAISSHYDGLENLVENMWETMASAKGCGLAAPQIGKALKLFVVDTKPTFEMLAPEERTGYFEGNDSGIQETFINARIINCSDENWEDYEGCLSIPDISQKVIRPWSITVEYFDLSFNKHLKTFGGYSARTIQHEHDHTEGILYIDRMNRLSRKLIDRKLKKIVKKQVKTAYRMSYK